MNPECIAGVWNDGELFAGGREIVVCAGSIQVLVIRCRSDVGSGVESIVAARSRPAHSRLGAGGVTRIGDTSGCWWVRNDGGRATVSSCVRTSDGEGLGITREV